MMSWLQIHKDEVCEVWMQRSGGSSVELKVDVVGDVDLNAISEVIQGLDLDAIADA